MKFLLDENEIDDLVNNNENIGDNGTPENRFNEFVAGKVMIAVATKMLDKIKSIRGGDTLALENEIAEAKRIYT